MEPEKVAGKYYQVLCEPQPAFLLVGLNNLGVRDYPFVEFSN